MKFTLLVAAFMLAAAGEVRGASTQNLVDWPKTIDCPAGRVYRDMRNGAGRDEYCELRLPGARQGRPFPVATRCFGKPVSLEDETLRSHLARLEMQEGIAKYLAPGKSLNSR